MATLKDKEHYIVHSANLKQAMEHGLKLRKVHRVLRFRQSCWMKPYIDMNNDVRANTTSKTKKDLAKLMNNAVFGKTIENVEKRRKIKLFDCWENQPTGKRGAVSFVSSGYLKKVTTFKQDFVAVELSTKVVKFDKPFQIGFTILELAKNKIYEFHYDLMKSMYPDPARVKLCYTDTDSFIYSIHTEDVYTDLKEKVHDPQREVEYFDTSDYPADNPYGFMQVNKKRLGAMKDECNGKVMAQFIGLRAKCYTFKVRFCHYLLPFIIPSIIWIICF